VNRANGGTGSSGVRQLFRERVLRDTLYGVASYWDARAAARSGMARSLWPSNAFNALWDDRQRALLVRTLGPIEGRRVVDIGCGTGRIVRFLCEERGAQHVLGIDFSRATIQAARDEAGALLTSGLVDYRCADILEGLDTIGVESFDDAIVLGCLSVACRDAASLHRAIDNVARLVRQGGRVLFLEPIHRSPLLRRVLDLGVEEWIACANRAGLALRLADRMGFVPARALLSVLELPRFIVHPLFSAGERLLDRAPYLSFLADYKLLLFDRTHAP